MEVRVMALDLFECSRGHTFAMDDEALDPEELRCPQCGAAIVDEDEDSDDENEDA